MIKTPDPSLWNLSPTECGPADLRQLPHGQPVARAVAGHLWLVTPLTTRWRWPMVSSTPWVATIVQLAIRWSVARRQWNAMIQPPIPGHWWAGLHLHLRFWFNSNPSNPSDLLAGPGPGCDWLCPARRSPDRRRRLRWQSCAEERGGVRPGAERMERTGAHGLRQGRRLCGGHSQCHTAGGPTAAAQCYSLV